MSEKFEIVRAYYDAGLWNASRVKNAVGKWITQDEYTEITGDPFGMEQ